MVSQDDTMDYQGDEEFETPKRKKVFSACSAAIASWTIHLAECIRV